MVVSPIHGRTHQIHGTGVHTQILLINMLLMNDPGYQMTIGSHHETPQFRVNRHISHTRRNQYFLIYFPDILADHPDIIGSLLRPVGNADTAGQIDKADIRPCLLPQLHRQFKQLLCQHRIVLVGHGVAGQKRMDTEMLHAPGLQNSIAFKHLLCGKTILGITRIVHDIRSQRKISAWIKAATHGLWQISQSLFQEINMCNIIQVNRCANPGRIGKFLRRGIIGGKHDILPRNPHGMTEHQLCHGGAVCAAAIFP